MGFRIGKTADGSVTVKPFIPEISSTVNSVPPPPVLVAEEPLVSAPEEAVVEVPTEPDVKNGLIELEEVPATVKAKKNKKAE